MCTDVCMCLIKAHAYCTVQYYSYLGKCVGIGPVAYEPSGHLRGVEHLLIHKLQHKQTTIILPSAQLGSQSTYIPRIPLCLSPRRNWDIPTPSPASERVPL